MLKNQWNRLRICLFGQTTKQPLSNFELWKSWNSRQLWGLEPDPGWLQKVKMYHKLIVNNRTLTLFIWLNFFLGDYFWAFLLFLLLFSFLKKLKICNLGLGTEYITYFNCHTQYGIVYSTTKRIWGFLTSSKYHFFVATPGKMVKVSPVRGTL